MQDTSRLQYAYKQYVCIFYHLTPTFKSSVMKTITRSILHISISHTNFAQVMPTWGVRSHDVDLFVPVSAAGRKGFPISCDLPLVMIYITVDGLLKPFMKTF